MNTNRTIETIGMMGLAFLFVALDTLAAGTADAGSGAVYRVPVVDERLKEVARFELSSFGLNREGGEWFLRFELPPELVGNGGSAIELRGPSIPEGGPGELDGESAHASCVSDRARTSCMLRYKATYDSSVERAVEAIRARYHSDPTLEDRIAVARAFAADPIGELVFDQKLLIVNVE